MKKRILPIIALLSIAALSATALPPPEKDEISVDKIDMQLHDLDGKIVEMEFSYVTSIKQKDSGTYTAYCKRWTDNNGYATSSGKTVHFSGEEALDYFEDLAKKSEDPWNSSLSESIYVLVEGKKLTAVGERFKKSKGIYTW